MFLVEGSISKCGNGNVITVGMGRNKGVAIRSHSAFRLQATKSWMRDWERGYQRLGNCMCNLSGSVSTDSVYTTNIMENAMNNVH